MKDKKNKLEEINEKKVNGYIVRARAEYLDCGEKNTNFFANLEKKRATAKTITRLNKDGKDIIYSKNILKELESYYKQLYKYQNIDTKNIKQFNKNINKKLTDDEIIV